MLRHRTGRALGLRGQRSQPFAAGPCGARSQHADERASKTRLFHMTAASEAWCKAGHRQKPFRRGPSTCHYSSVGRASARLVGGKWGERGSVPASVMVIVSFPIRCGAARLTSDDTVYLGYNHCSYCELFIMPSVRDALIHYIITNMIVTSLRNIANVFDIASLVIAFKIKDIEDIEIVV